MELPKAELQKRAREAGIAVNRDMKKQELVDALQGRLG